MPSNITFLIHGSIFFSMLPDFLSTTSSIPKYLQMLSIEQVCQARKPSLPEPGATMVSYERGSELVERKAGKRNLQTELIALEKPISVRGLSSLMNKGAPRFL